MEKNDAKNHITNNSIALLVLERARVVLMHVLQNKLRDRHRAELCRNGRLATKPLEKIRVLFLQDSLVVKNVLLRQFRQMLLSESSKDQVKLQPAALLGVVQHASALLLQLGRGEAVTCSAEKHALSSSE